MEGQHLKLEDTARFRAMEMLREAGERGMSKSQLRVALEVNPGVFRRLIMSMEDKEQVTITEEMNPNWGPTKIVRARAGA